MKKFINKPTHLTVIGIFMLLGGFIIGGFLLFPLAAIVLGENLLENDSGNLTIIGSAIISSPYLVAISLIAYDLFFRMKKQANNKSRSNKPFPYAKVGWGSIILGIGLAIVGYGSLLTYDQDKGANIGAGFLIFGSWFFLGIGFLTVFINLLISTFRKQD